MPPLAEAGRRIGAVLAGLLAGAIVNVGIVLVGATVVAPPPGVDPADGASIRAHIAEYSVLQLMPPLVAHGAGTLVGATVAAMIAGTRAAGAAMAVGGIFLLGGVAMVRAIPETPTWFAVVDLGGAYLPTAWLGHLICLRWRRRRAARGSVEPPDRGVQRGGE